MKEKQRVNFGGRKQREEEENANVKIESIIIGLVRKIHGSLFNSR